MTFATRDPHVLRDLAELGFTRLVLRSPLPEDARSFAAELHSRLEAFEHAVSSALADAATYQA
jgi:hypothetical protein